MPGIKRLQRLQIGAETIPGTAVTATTTLRVRDALLEDARQVEFPKEDVGLVVPTHRAYTTHVLGRLEFEAEATFEQLPYILQAGVLKITSPQSDGSGSGKIWNFTFPTTAQQTVQTYTLYTGDNQSTERMSYGVVESFKLSGAAQEAIRMSASWFGREVTGGTFASVTVPEVETILFQKARLFIDDPGSIGTTEVSQTLVGFTLDIKTGLIPVFTGSGNLYFDALGYSEDGFSGTLEITFLHNASAVSEKTAWRNHTARAIQIKVTGNALTTGGTTYQNKTLVINCYGRWEKFDKIGVKDGNDIVTGTLRLGYDPVAATMGSIVVVNELTSLP
jgi:hypothetical protein